MTDQLPNGAVIVLRHSDGREVDVASAVQALYDLVLDSMDWGSGFLTFEDALPVAVLAHECGFGDVERVDAYVSAAAAKVERRLEMFRRRAPTSEAVRNDERLLDRWRALITEHEEVDRG